MMETQSDVGIVIIGRNEGQRLIDCLTSLRPHLPQAVYVDSGSSDDSVGEAGRLGARTLLLDTSAGFTAARARNAGAELLRTELPHLRFIQFVDGDCLVDERWIGTALARMQADPAIAVVCGRRRERRPDATIYNWLCDREWDTPVGEAGACGGDALIRREAFDQVGGYDGDLVAGEEPEMCLRLRRKGWTIWREDAEMTRHDAAITRFGQWWRRSVRAGHAFAEVSWMYRRSDDRIWQDSTVRAVGWTALLPATLCLAAVVHPLALLLLLVYPAQIARLALREGWRDARHWKAAFFSVAGKFAETVGVAKFHMNRLRAQKGGLIEYK